MTHSSTPLVRAVVVATLLVATATLMLVAVNTVRAAGVQALRPSGEGLDFAGFGAGRQSAPAERRAAACRVRDTGGKVYAFLAISCGANG